MGVPPRTYLIILIVFCIAFGGRIVRTTWMRWRAERRARSGQSPPERP